MNIHQWGLLTLFVTFQSYGFAQKLKRADRTIVSNIQAHVKSLGGNNSSEYQAGSASEKAAGEYIGRHFAKAGLKPMGDSNGWFQQFPIYDGKEIKKGTSLTINGNKLRLHDDFFPFSFSANKNTEAAVAIALAENGVPWFKDLKEILETEESASIDTLAYIRKKAISAAEKGASALVVYNSGDMPDIKYDRFNTLPDVTIPVIYLDKEAFKKYCSDESEIIDVAIHVDKEEKNRKGMNVIGFADHKADSTIIAAAHLDNEAEVAALMEVARLVKQGKNRRKNYLFIAYCGEQQGAKGMEYYKEHPVTPNTAASRMVHLDSVSVANSQHEGLNLVRQSVELIK